MIGGEVFDASLEALAPFGRLVTYGIVRREDEHRQHAQADARARARSSASGSATASSARPSCSTRRSPTCSRARRAASCASSSGATYPLAEAAQAQIDLAERRTTGKLLLDVRA